MPTWILKVAQGPSLPSLRELVSIRVGYLSLGGYAGESVDTYHFPLGGTTMGAAVVFVVLDMTFLARLVGIQDKHTLSEMPVHLIVSIYDSKR